LPGGAPDVSALFSAQGISSESESQNFFQPQKPARRKKHFPPPEPPEWALEGSLSADGSGALYSCIPARAIRDKGIRGQVLAVLGCVCLFTSRKGLAYPNQKTMGRILGISQPAVSRAMRKLRDAGYVRFLEPKGRRLPGAFQRGRRYQVLVRGNDPLPEKESVLKTR
jgi:DNA-binding transcriptional ArsR family regulator